MDEPFIATQSQMSIIQSSIAPAFIHILPPNGEQGKLLSIHSDGQITFGPSFTTVDEASLEFWRRLAAAFPKFLEQAASSRT
jgi:hypothetical protein